MRPVTTVVVAVILAALLIAGAVQFFVLTR